MGPPERREIQANGRGASAKKSGTETSVDNLKGELVQDKAAGDHVLEKAVKEEVHAGHGDLKKSGDANGDLKPLAVAKGDAKADHDSPDRGKIPSVQDAKDLTPSKGLSGVGLPGVQGKRLDELCVDSPDAEPTARGAAGASPSLNGYGKNLSSGNNSEVEDELASDFSITSVSQGGDGRKGASGRQGDTLDLSSSLKESESPVPDLTVPTISVTMVEPKGGLDVGREGASAKPTSDMNSIGSHHAAISAPTIKAVAPVAAADPAGSTRLITEIESLKRSMKMLTEIREKQQEYLRLLKTMR